MVNVVRATLVLTAWTGDAESVIAKPEEHAPESARRPARVIGFQEVVNAPYFCQDQDQEHDRWAESVAERPTVGRMRDLAHETGMVVAPVSEAEGPGSTTTRPP